MSKTGKRLIGSAQQALVYAKGTANKAEYRVHITDKIEKSQATSQTESDEKAQGEFLINPENRS